MRTKDPLVRQKRSCSAFTPAKNTRSIRSPPFTLLKAHLLHNQAVRYPNGSALEHHAATVALRLLASGPCAPVLGAMPDAAKAERVASLLPALLVAGDAARLPRVVARLQARCGAEQAPLDCRGSHADAALLCAALLHAALACAGAAAPWAAASAWGGLRGAEWVLQGALEREARLETTSPLMDAATADVARAEAGLLAHCALPLLRALSAGPVPWAAATPLRRCEANVLSWGARVRAGLPSPPPEAPAVAGVALDCVRSVTARRARIAAGLDPDAPLPPLPSAGTLAAGGGGSSAGNSPVASRAGSFMLRASFSSAQGDGSVHGGALAAAQGVAVGYDSGRLAAAAVYGSGSFRGYGGGYGGAGGSFRETEVASVSPRGAALARQSSGGSAMDLEAGSVGDPYDAGGARLSFSSAAGSGRMGGMSRIRAIATQRVRLRRMQSSGALNQEAEASVSGGYAAAEQSVRMGGPSVRGGNTSVAGVDAMSGAELSAAALAAAKRNAASARDVALCLGIADAAPLAEAADGEPAVSTTAPSLLDDDGFEVVGNGADVSVAEQPDGAATGSPGRWNPAALLRRRTFRMSDLGGSDADAGGTLDSSTAVALGVATKAGASALFALPAVAPPPHRRAWAAVCASAVRFRARPRIAATAALVEGAQWQSMMLVLTIYVLFAEDIKDSSLPPSVDHTFRGAAAFVFAAFVLELLIRCVCEDAFFGRFFFWLDLGAALSLLPDFIPQENAAELAYGRAGRAARVGARLGRIVRFVRVVQQLRALALERMRSARLERRMAALAAAEEAEASALGVPVEALRAAQNASRRLQLSAAARVAAATAAAGDWAHEEEPTGAARDDNAKGASQTEVVGEDGRTARRRRASAAPSHGATGMARASAVWERLNTAMSRKLILGLLSVIIVLPFLEVHLRDFSPDLFLASLEDWPIGSEGFNATLASFAAFGGGGSDAARRLAISVDVCGAPGVVIATLPPGACDDGVAGVAWVELLRRGAAVQGPGVRRASELLTVLSASQNSLVIYDIKPERVLEAKFNAALTIGIVGLLLIWAYYFAKDAHRLLINPIGKMVSLINLLAENPIQCVSQCHACCYVANMHTCICAVRWR